MATIETELSLSVGLLLLASRYKWLNDKTQKIAISFFRNDKKQFNLFRLLRVVLNFEKKALSRVHFLLFLVNVIPSFISPVCV